jgi:hypothetical protein
MKIASSNAILKFSMAASSLDSPLLLMSKKDYWYFLAHKEIIHKRTELPLYLHPELFRVSYFP